MEWNGMGWDGMEWIRLLIVCGLLFHRHGKRDHLLSILLWMTPIIFVVVVFFFPLLDTVLSTGLLIRLLSAALTTPSIDHGDLGLLLRQRSFPSQCQLVVQPARCQVVRWGAVEE